MVLDNLFGYIRAERERAARLQALVRRKEILAQRKARAQEDELSKYTQAMDD